ncbi:glycerophosphodiester phosphodiesterase [Falseniella ignava]
MIDLENVLQDIEDLKLKDQKINLATISDEDLLKNSFNLESNSSEEAFAFEAEAKKRGLLERYDEMRNNAPSDSFQNIGYAVSNCDVYFSNRVVPKLIKQTDKSILVTIPKGPNLYTRLFASNRAGKILGELWSYGFSENASKARYSETYKVPSWSGLYWNLDSNTLVTETVKDPKKYKNINLLVNIDGEVISGHFSRYLMTNLSTKVNCVFYTTTGHAPSFVKSGNDLIINMPKPLTANSQILLQLGEQFLRLFPAQFEVNNDKKTFQPSYRLSNYNALYWDIDSNSLQVASIDKISLDNYVLLALNAHGSLVGGDFYRFKIDNVKNDLNQVMSLKASPYTFISRQGELGGRPENSLAGCLYAKENGYDDIRVSVKLTSDNIPVLFHDDLLKIKVRNADGSLITSALKIGELTYEQLANYDFGVYWGQQYKGTKVTKLLDFIELCAFKGINPTLEIKEQTLTSEQVLAIIEPVVMYGLTTKTFVSTSKVNVLDAIFEKCKALNFGLITYPIEGKIEAVLKYKHLSNQIRLELFDINNPTFDYILQAQNNGIMVEVGTCYSVESIKKWMKKGVDIIEVANVANPKAVLYNEL